MKTFSRQFAQASCFHVLFPLLLTFLLAACGQDQPGDKPPSKGSTETTTISADSFSGPPVSDQMVALLKKSFLLDDVLFVLNSYKNREAAAEYFIPHVAEYPFNETYTEGNVITDEFLAPNKQPVYSFRLRYDKESEEIIGSLVALIPEQGEKGKELAAVTSSKSEKPPTKDDSIKYITYPLGIMVLGDGRKMQLTLTEDVFADKSIFTVVYEVQRQPAQTKVEKKK